MGSTVAHRRDRTYVAGQWRDTDAAIAVTDLTTGSTFAEIAAADPGVARTALAAAKGVEPTLRQTSVVERAEWCESIARGIDARAEELADVIVREAGKPIGSARGEVDAAAERFRRAAEEARLIASRGEFREGSTDGHEGWRAIVKREPIGTVLCITPYNYPLATIALQVAPALATGNAVVLKPASQTPVSATILAEIVSTVDGIPPGAFNVVTGRAREIGDVLSGDDRVDAIAMTGSTGAGKHVARESGMVNLHMELGGNAPAIVFSDADLDDVAGNCAKGSFKYAGQRCSAVSRVLVEESVHDAVVEKLDDELATWRAGDLFSPDTQLGPLISESQAEWVEELVEDAVERGATLVRGGERDGRFFEPTLLASVPHDARIVHEEQFGPVIPVVAFEDESEALSLANGGDLGLDAAVFTNTYDRAMRMATHIEAGGVRINGAPSHGLGDIPFGGVKDSGIGREGLGVTIESFTQTKSIIL